MNSEESTILSNFYDTDDDDVETPVPRRLATIIDDDDYRDEDPDNDSIDDKSFPRSTVWIMGTIAVLMCLLVVAGGVVLITWAAVRPMSTSTSSSGYPLSDQAAAGAIRNRTLPPDETVGSGSATLAPTSGGAVSNSTTGTSTPNSTLEESPTQVPTIILGSSNEVEVVFNNTYPSTSNDINATSPPESTFANGTDSSTTTINNTTSINVTVEDIPMFSPAILQGYATPRDLEDAVTKAAMALTDQIIESNLQNLKNNQQYPPNVDYMQPPVAAMEMDTEVAAGSSAMRPNDGGDTGHESLTDFETNNQEESVDEADIIKADANFIYAAYGDYILVWNPEGKKVEQVAMPPVPGYDDAPGDKPPQSRPTTGEARKAGMVAPDYYIRKPRIESMLLTNHHLVAVVSGYGPQPNFYYEDVVMMAEDKQSVPPILNNRRALQIRLYEKSLKGRLLFVGYKDVNGNWMDGRAMEENIHIATSTGINIWNHLQQPLDPWRMEQFEEEPNKESNRQKVSKEEAYRDWAKAKAQAIIPAFVRQLRVELALHSNNIFDKDDLPKFLRINQWRTTAEPDQTETTAGTASGADQAFSMPGSRMSLGNDIMNNMVQVASFNVKEVAVALAARTNKTDQEFAVTASAFLCPSSYGHLYGTEGHLVLATQGWDWSPFLRSSRQTTYLVTLKVEGASTKFVSIGTLDGRILNEYALDIVGNELRVATTVDTFGGWMIAEPMPIAVMAEGDATDVIAPTESVICQEPDNDSQCETMESFEQCKDLQKVGCVSITASDACPPIYSCANSKCGAPVRDDDCDTFESYINCLSLDLHRQCQLITQTVECPPRYLCMDDSTDSPTKPPRPTEPPMQESRTKNFMVVLEIESQASSGIMSEKGRVQIGEPNESITAVRFFDNIAYAVTFEQTDPFYVLNMSVPEVLGELKLPGFSNYLHPMHDNNNLLVAVGQNADESGRVLGAMVTVFDSTDPAQPKALVNYTFEDRTDSASSSSSSQWDYKAFRFLKSVGKLVIPMDIYYYQTTEQSLTEDLPENFIGFVVLDVNSSSISEQFRVSHTQKKGTCRYCDGWLPSRSFVYDGNLMTVRDSLVISTNLESEEVVWQLPLAIDGVTNDCCY